MFNKGYEGSCHEIQRLPWLEERFYADGSFPKLNGERGATGQRRRSLLWGRALSRSASEDAQEVGEQILDCREDGRCNCGGCPTCLWAAGRWFRSTLASTTKNAEQIIFATVQLTDEAALPYNLDTIDIVKQKKRLANALEDAGLKRAPVFGAADISLDVWPSVPTVRWSVHWALFSIDRDAAAFTSCLTAVLEKNALVPTPVKTKVVRVTPDRVFSYGFKNVFERKILPKSSDSSRLSRFIGPGDTHFEELALALDRIGIAGRFFIQAWPI